MVERGDHVMATPAPVPRPVSNGTTPKPTPTTGKPSRIGAIKRGQLRSSLRHLFYGPEGVGKSSLAADAPKPLFIDVEGGADNIDVARYMFRDEDGGHVPRSYSEVTAAIEDLIANPGHGHETLVLDTIDALEALVHRHVCETNGKTSIEEFGFGKGYQVALDEFRRFLAQLDTLRAKGMQVVMLGHSIVKTFKNPEGEDYDRYQLRVHDKTGGLIKEWCDVVGFVRFDGGAAKLKGDASQAKRARGWSTGKRVVHLARDAAWDAKSRLSLPAEIELDVAHPWLPFALASGSARESTPEELTAQITAELDRIAAETFTTAAGNPTTRTAVLAMVAKSDASTLTRILAGLKATAAAQES
jgi:hypothetical protein